jgi:phospholipase C
MADQLSAINHIVVLMLENRSFDHMLGLLYFGEWQCLARGSAF